MFAQLQRTSFSNLALGILVVENGFDAPHKYARHSGMTTSRKPPLN